MICIFQNTIKMKKLLDTLDMEYETFSYSEITNIQFRIPDDILSLLKKESNYILKNED